MNTLARAGCMLFICLGGGTTLIGVLLMYAGWRGQQLDEDYLSRAIETQATVVDVGEQRNANGRTRHVITYVFQDEEGRTRKQEMTAYDRAPGLAKGNKLAILYDPQDPQDVRSPGVVNPLRFGMLALGVILIVGGGGVVVISLVVLRFCPSRKCNSELAASESERTQS